VGRAQPRLLVRRAGPRLERREGRLKPRGVGIDLAVVPGLLLLVARDLALYDPPRVLAWRLTHDAQLAGLARWLGPLVPAASGVLDRDPIALLLSALAVLAALAYGTLAVAGASVRARALTIGLASVLLVVLPSVAFISLGAAADRPYGQDGGVVQLPLAIDKILAGESPYGADYSGTILAKQARVSSFWGARGGNPILHHHAYLPGTHLVMLPFQLALERALGFFDPRVVTLVFYALVVVLASRLPASGDARLAAAGVAALNPLVYWQQIFGANDLVFVAMLLGTVLLLRTRPTAAAALLGLACATKQLAWPFAPFLLLSCSGAGSFRDLLAPRTWRRLGRPLAVTTAVFLAVVLPVAALDWRAFWGDIFVYNAGLPGGDNYPLGGTPGFGFANFLIYFGRVASLADYFPFTVFYALLVPFGLLLVRAQLRAGEPERALVTGSAALVASLYFSRVVHPNYLIPVAVLLPLPLLAKRRRADLALVPLLLLALAVEIAEQQPFRSAWEQASAAGLPARLGGLLVALAPKAGSQLTRDPLGLLFSAVAAGLAALYLAIGSVTSGAETEASAPASESSSPAADVARSERGRAPCRPWRLRLGWRGGIVVTGALLVVTVPTLALVRVGERTGLVRAQDPAVVQAQADARRLAAGRSPYSPPLETAPQGREAISSSFRLDPPASIEPDHPLLPPGPSVLGAALRVVGLRDLRIVGLLALAALGLAVVRATAYGGPALAAVALFAPPLAVGTALGSPLPLALAALVGAWLAARRGRSVPAGVWAGLAAACDHRAALAAIVLVMTLRSQARTPAALRPAAKALVAAVASYALVVVPVMLLDTSAFLDRVRQVALPGPGLGVFNLLAYRGAEGSVFALGVAAISPLLALVATAGLLRLAAPAPAVAALASLTAIVLAPALSPEIVALPLVLGALAVAESTDTSGASS
jgi:hypothetical protein